MTGRFLAGAIVAIALTAAWPRAGAAIADLPLVPSGVTLDLDVFKAAGGGGGNPGLIDLQTSDPSRASLAASFSSVTTAFQSYSGAALASTTIRLNEVVLVSAGNVVGDTTSNPAGSPADVPRYEATSSSTLFVDVPPSAGDLTVSLEGPIAGWSFVDPFGGALKIRGGSLSTSVVLTELEVVTTNEDLLTTPIELLPGQQSLLSVPPGETLRATAVWQLAALGPYAKTALDDRVLLLPGFFSETHSLKFRAETACSDEADNDGDGLVDYPVDPGCAGPAADSEEPECADDVDNDGDGHIDYLEDAGCVAPSDPSEEVDCSDGVDNDGDGLVDHPDDPGCRDAAGGRENPACDNRVDDDSDGLIDADDPTCEASPWRNREKSQRCGLGHELPLVLLPAMWLLRRRRRSAGV